MLHIDVDQGALFYGKTRRRQDVTFESTLRQETENLAAELHHLIQAGETPKPVYSKKCDSCSFFNQCIPKQLHGKKSVENYLAQMIGAK